MTSAKVRLLVVDDTKAVSLKAFARSEATRSDMFSLDNVKAPVPTEKNPRFKSE